MVEATQKPSEAVEYAWEVVTKNCIWSVNEGFGLKRTQWTIDNDVAAGDIDAAKKPTVDQVVDMKLANEASPRPAGGSSIGGCTE